MAERVGTVIVGGGVVGLAIARGLARANGDLLILERAAGIGSGVSSRNSEVVHGGMYYAPGSLKARCCVAGRRLLEAYARERGVEHRRVGKLIVATEEGELEQLRRIADRAARNGLTAPDEILQWLDRDAARRLEPELECLGALHSPSTGIIDTHALMLASQGDAERDGAVLATATEFVGASRHPDGWRVRTRGPDGEFELDCALLVNAAGLQAQRVAATIDSLEARHIPKPLWLKGNYFTVLGRQPRFSRLIYPVPAGGGLGVHLTMDLGGQARFGPDAETIDPAAAEHDAPDYAVDPGRAAGFYAAIRRYWPALEDGSLQPAYSGIRPKLAPRANDEEATDFVISGPGDHGLPGLVQLFGIESPGITASLALADEVKRVLEIN